MSVTSRPPSGETIEIGAARDAVSAADIAAEGRQRLAATGTARRDDLRLASAQSQASSVSTASAGRNTSRFGMARSAARCSTGWCVGPSSPRPMESWVITWMTRMPHQGRKADRRPAVIGEGEEGAAIGNEAAMQREAVHRGRHAVLADAVMDVVAGERVARDRRLRLGMRQVRMRQVGRAADRSGNCPGDAVEHLLRSLPRRELRTLGGKALAQFRRGLGIGVRQGNRLALDKQVALLGRRAFVAIEPGETLDLPALPDHPPCFQDRDRHHEGLIVPAERSPRRRGLLGAERRAMRLLGALTIRRAVADDGAAGDQRRSCALALLGNRLRNRFGIVPVDTAHRPAGGSEARELVVRGRERGRAVNGDAVVVEQHDQAGQAARWPASEIASWLMPSIRQPSPAIT